MSEPFIAEIKIFAGTFAPRGYALCNGALLPIAQNTALFSLIGTTYGGDGRTTTALPNLSGRAPMHDGSGTGPGLSLRTLGQKGGTETETLSEAQMPNHTHSMRSLPLPGDASGPIGNTFARVVGANPYSSNVATADMAPEMITSTGGGQSHDNMQPYLAMNFIIALVGTYPSRS